MGGHRSSLSSTDNPMRQQQNSVSNDRVHHAQRFSTHHVIEGPVSTCKAKQPAGQLCKSLHCESLYSMESQSRCLHPGRHAVKLDLQLECFVGQEEQRTVDDTLTSYYIEPSLLYI